MAGPFNGRDPPKQFSGGSDDDKRGRLWGGLTAILILFALMLKAFSVATWWQAGALVVLLSGGLAALIFKK